MKYFLLVLTSLTLSTNAIFPPQSSSDTTPQLLISPTPIPKDIYIQARATGKPTRPIPKTRPRYPTYAITSLHPPGPSIPMHHTSPVASLRMPPAPSKRHRRPRSTKQSIMRREIVKESGMSPTRTTSQVSPRKATSRKTEDSKPTGTRKPDSDDDDDAPWKSWNSTKTKTTMSMSKIKSTTSKKRPTTKPTSAKKTSSTKLKSSEQRPTSKPSSAKKTSSIKPTPNKPASTRRASFVSSKRQNSDMVKSSSRPMATKKASSIKPISRGKPALTRLITRGFGSIA